MPHTGVTPYPRSARDVKRPGVLIKWNTNDNATLAKLHNTIVRLVQAAGVSGLAAIANNAKTTAQVAKTSGGSRRDTVKQAGQDGAAFPVPDDVIKYIKGFG
jgi:predicted short-subunit dehydrogenase-like oxidoreductase (DUF2520 family)